MHATFPVKETRNFLKESVHDWLENDLSEHAKSIVDLHLDRMNFAMPRKIDKNGLHEAFLHKKPASQLRKFIQFEDTHFIQGICRVMVRTHLNRTGVGFVSRGESDKTQAYRVLGLFSDNFRPDDLIDWQALTSAWIEFAEKSMSNTAISRNHPRQFNSEDITSLCNLAKLTPNQIREVKKIPGIHNNWAKVVVGVHSGLNYLSKYYDFDPNRIWKKIDKASTSIQGVHALITEAQREIIEYGQPLAGSFFADLGAERFVKVDKHVREAIAAFLRKKPSAISDDLAFDIVQRSSEEHGITPRALDKIMYLASSTNLYLIGHRQPKTEQRKQKNRFLSFLSSLA